MRTSTILFVFCFIFAALASHQASFAVASESGECVSNEAGECINPDAEVIGEEEVAADPVDVESDETAEVPVASEEATDAEEADDVTDAAEESKETTSEETPAETADEEEEEAAAEEEKEDVVESSEEEVVEEAAPEETATATDSATEEEENTPGCPSRSHVIKCAAKYLDTNGNELLERAELQSAIDKLPWLSRGILTILGSVDKMMAKCDMDGDDAIGLDYDMKNNGETCLATCFKRRAFKSAFFSDCEA